MEGQLAIWKSGLNKDYPCYECVFPKTNEKAPITNCREAGIIGPVTGLIGSMQVNEAIKEIALKDYQSSAGNLFLYDGLTQNLDKIKLNKKLSMSSMFKLKSMKIYIIYKKQNNFIFFLIFLIIFFIIYQKMPLSKTKEPKFQSMEVV